MNIQEFLAKLSQADIILKVENGKVICNAPKGSITEDIRSQISRHKNEIIDFLGKTSEKYKWSPVVPIQPIGDRYPFFCFHGVGGNVLNYKTLVPYLPNDQPLYGIQSIGLDGITPPFTKIEPMAEYYLKEIRKIQPRGPFFLGGGSMGGMVAFEVAQQIIGQGGDIGILVMFDTVGPYHGASRTKRIFKKVLSQTPLETFNAVVGTISEKREDKTRLTECLSFIEKGEPIPHDLRPWYIRKMNFAAMAAYEFKTLNGEITLIKGSDEKDGLFSDPKRGWEGIPTNLKIWEVPGHHDSLVEEPLLGETLSKCLEAAQRKAETAENG